MADNGEPRTRTQAESSHEFRNRGGPPRVSPSAPRPRSSALQPSTKPRSCISYTIHIIRVIQLTCIITFSVYMQNLQYT